MDTRVRDFLETVALSLVGLDVTLFFQTNPDTFDTADGIALRTHRAVGDIEPALERLTECGILESFRRGEDRYPCYALAREAETWDLLCQISEAYVSDPEARKEIVRLLMATQAEERGGSCDMPATGCDEGVPS